MCPHGPGRGNTHNELPPVAFISVPPTEPGQEHAWQMAYQGRKNGDEQVSVKPPTCHLPFPQMTDHCTVILQYIFPENQLPFKRWQATYSPKLIFHFQGKFPS